MKKRTPKQIAALACVVIIALCYIAAFFAAVFDSSQTGNIFRGALVCTVFVPILCWIFIWLYGQATQNRTIADLDILQTDKSVATPSTEEISETENKEKQSPNE